MAHAGPDGPLPTALATSGPRAGWLARREALYGYAFISPWILGLIAFTAGPLLAVFYLSLTEYPILSEPTFIGTGNYARIFAEDRAFWLSLVNTASYVAIRVPLHLGLAFGLALLLHRTVRGIGVFRTAIYLPSMIPIVALSVVWRVLLDPRAGYVNYVGGLIGLPQINWLTSSDWARPVIIFVSLWQVGIPMIIFLAGLGAIPDQLYEAAAIDGAGWGRRLLNVTLPMMTPVILYNVIIDIINSFQVFAFAFILTKGGPNDATLFYVLYIYRQAFEFFQMGYASALSTILFVIVLLLTVVVLRSSRYWVQYERI
jgi:multiple sugar transport system permease protein